MNDRERQRIASKITEAIVDTILVDVALTGVAATGEELAAIAVGAAALFVKGLCRSPVSHLACCLVAHVDRSTLEAHRAVSRALDGARELERVEVTTGQELLDRLNIRGGREA